MVKSVTFGQPIYLTEFLNKEQPNWREQDYSSCDYRPHWAPSTVDKLAHHVVTGINTAASVNPINLLALSLLPTPRQALDEQQLIKQMEAYRALLNARPYSDITVITEGAGQDWLQHGESLDAVSRCKHELGI